VEATGAVEAAGQAEPAKAVASRRRRRKPTASSDTTSDAPSDAPSGAGKEGETGRVADEQAFGVPAQAEDGAA
jgi:hypothetical protein